MSPVHSKQPKVAFLTYPSAFQNIGGGEILLLKLKEYLEKGGVPVDLFDTWHARVESYDLLHVFGSVKDCLGLARVANARRVKVATTPILWADWRMALFNNEEFRDKLLFSLRYLTKVVWPHFPSSRRKLLTASDLIFPNSEMEKKQITRLFGIPQSKMKVIYNGVDVEFGRADAKLFTERYGRQPFILGVGRIEPRKNQLNLIRAVKKLGGQKLRLIGNVVSGHESYEAACRKEGDGFVDFVPAMKHEDPLFRSAYAACSLFAAPGWFETPGLAALEAALAGARVLVTSGGSTREYFGKYADYLDPADVKDIERKISLSLAKPKDPLLKEHVLQNFSWEAIAERTLACYKEILSI